VGHGLSIRSIQQRMTAIRAASFRLVLLRYLFFFQFRYDIDVFGAPLLLGTFQEYSLNRAVFKLRVRPILLMFQPLQRVQLVCKVNFALFFIKKFSLLLKQAVREAATICPL